MNKLKIISQELNRQCIISQSEVDRYNREYEKYLESKKHLEECNRLNVLYGQYVVVLKNVLVLLQTEILEYKKRRLQAIDSALTDALNKVFPAWKFVAETECDFKRNNTHLRLKLFDLNSKVERMPWITEGEYCKQLVSFVATVTILNLIGGTPKLYLDESFNGADSENIEVSGEFIKSSVKNGMQVLLISHTPSLYHGITRKEFHLGRDVKEGTFIKEEEVINCDSL